MYLWLKNLDCPLLRSTTLLRDWRKNMRDYKVSVVIPTYNTWVLTQNLISDLERHERENIDSLILVDDASTQETQTLRTDLPIFFERLKVNSGFPVACNAGLKMTSNNI